jgi:hypothetical protein
MNRISGTHENNNYFAQSEPSVGLEYSEDVSKISEAIPKCFI